MSYNLKTQEGLATLSLHFFHWYDHAYWITESHVMGILTLQVLPLPTCWASDIEVIHMTEFFHISI